MALHCFKVVSDILNRLLLAKLKKGITGGET